MLPRVRHVGMDFKRRVQRRESVLRGPPLLLRRRPTHIHFPSDLRPAACPACLSVSE